MSDSKIRAKSDLPRKRGSHYYKRKLAATFSAV